MGDNESCSGICADQDNGASTLTIDVKTNLLKYFDAFPTGNNGRFAYTSTISTLSSGIISPGLVKL